MKPVKEGQKPCGQCPYLTTSTKGYLGGNDVDTYADPISHDILINCHLTGDLPYEDQHICVGLIYSRVNNCKHGKIEPFLESEAVVRNYPSGERVKCFLHRVEFINHHTL